MYQFYWFWQIRLTDRLFYDYIRDTQVGVNPTKERQMAAKSFRSPGLGDRVWDAIMDHGGGAVVERSLDFLGKLPCGLARLVLRPLVVLTNEWPTHPPPRPPDRQ